MEINENSIRERAQWLWKEAGSPDGQDLDFWLQAERALADEGNDGAFKPHHDDEQTANPNAFSPTPWGTQS